MGDTGVKIAQEKEKRETERVCPASLELPLHTAGQGPAQLCHIRVKISSLFWACLQDN